MKHELSFPRAHAGYTPRVPGRDDLCRLEMGDAAQPMTGRLIKSTHAVFCDDLEVFGGIVVGSMVHVIVGSR